MHIGNRIKKIRESLGINRKEFARGIISYSHLCNIEDGNYNASEDIMIAIAEKLNVSADYLLKYNTTDYKLENLLIYLKSELDQLNIKDVEAIIKTIKKDHSYISSILQEIFFFLLEIYYFLSTGEINKAKKLFQNEVVPLLVDVTIENLTDEYKETYYYIQGVINYHEESYRLSYKFFLKQLPLVKNNLMKARTNHNIAICLYKMKNIDNSIKYAIESLNQHLIERKWNKIAEVDNLLGVLYTETRQYDEAISSLNNALELIGKNNLEYLNPKVLHNLGEVSQFRKDYDEALKFYNESLNLKKKDNIDIFITYYRILEIYLDLRLFDQLTLFLNEAKGICKNKYEIYQLKLIEGKTFLDKGDNQKYEKTMKEAIRYLYQIKLWNRLEEYTEEFAKYYLQQRKYKIAAEYFNLSIKIYKTLYKGEM